MYCFTYSSVMWNPTLQTFQTSPEEVSREFWKQTPNSFSACPWRILSLSIVTSESMNSSVIPAYKGQVIVGWANMLTERGCRNTHLLEWYRGVLVIIGSFYPDILIRGQQRTSFGPQEVAAPRCLGNFQVKSSFWCARRVFVLCPFRGVCSTSPLGALKDCNQQS